MEQLKTTNKIKPLILTADAYGNNELVNLASLLKKTF